MPLPAGNQTLTNSDQTVTKVDKTDLCQPLRHTPNNPEQTRTPPNASTR